MSLLTGAQILQRMDEIGELRLVITPFFDKMSQLNPGSASVDLRLGCRFSAAKRGSLTHVGKDQPSQQTMDEYYVPFGQEFVLHPRHFVLATTLEWIRLPETLGGYVIGRSSYGRMGLIIATAVGVHPKYSGVLTLELTNLGEVPITLRPGQAICQLFLHEVRPVGGESTDRSAFVGSLFPRLGSVDEDAIEAFLNKLDGRTGSEGKV